MPTSENMTAFWVEGLKRFWESTAAACDDEEGALGEVKAGVAVIVGFARRGFGRGGPTASEDDPQLDDQDQTQDQTEDVGA